MINTFLFLTRVVCSGLQLEHQFSLKWFQQTLLLSWDTSGTFTNQSEGCNFKEPDLSIYLSNNEKDIVVSSLFIQYKLPSPFVEKKEWKIINFSIFREKSKDTSCIIDQRYIQCIPIAKK